MNERSAAPAPAAPPESSRREAAIVARGVSKHYVGGDGTRLHILNEIELEVAPGETVAIIGQSGVGKSTLLQILGGLDVPDTGTVELGGTAIGGLGEAALAHLRNERIGFVFQFHHLLREFSALENVMMPQLIGGRSAGAAERRARDLLTAVGLEGRLSHKPAQLSGGEQQRVAVARALVNQPRVILADEPSGNLDPQTSEPLHDLFFRVSQRENVAMILVTHNLELAGRADRVLRLIDGRLVSAVAVGSFDG